MQLKALAAAGIIALLTMARSDSLQPAKLMELGHHVRSDARLLANLAGPRSLEAQSTSRCEKEWENLEYATESLVIQVVINVITHVNTRELANAIVEWNRAAGQVAVCELK